MYEDTGMGLVPRQVLVPPSVGPTAGIWIVEMDGELLAAGAPYEYRGGPGIGAVHVFVRRSGSWALDEVITTGSAGSSGERFGYALGISADTLVAGAPLGDAFAGAVWVFRRGLGGWEREAILVSPMAQSGADFGWSVAISGDTAVVGAPEEDSELYNEGAAYVFERVGGAWRISARLRSQYPATMSGFQFGNAVAIAGDLIAVGSRRGAGGGAGIVQLFRREGGTWGLEDWIYQPDADNASQFGYPLALEERRLLVGANRDWVGGQRQGSAYVFEPCGGEWLARAKLIASDGQWDDSFGYGLDFEGGTIVVGAYGIGLSTGGPGGLYHFDLDSTDPFNAYCFGDGSGAGCPCGNPSPPGHGEGCAHSGGGGGRLLAFGSNNATVDNLVLHACGLVPGAPALLFAGTTSLGGGDGLPFGDGLRCVGGAVVRVGIETVDGDGGASYGPGLAAAGGWANGGERRLQVWYRDPTGGPCGSSFNLTSAFAVTFL
jgi:hypothetical protein